MRLEGSDNVKEEDHFLIFPNDGDSAPTRPDERVPVNQVEGGEIRAENFKKDGREVHPQIYQDVYT